MPVEHEPANAELAVLRKECDEAEALEKQLEEKIKKRVADLHPQRPDESAEEHARRREEVEAQLLRPTSRLRDLATAEISTYYVRGDEWHKRACFGKCGEVVRLCAKEGGLGKLRLHETNVAWMILFNYYSAIVNSSLYL